MRNSSGGTRRVYTPYQHNRSSVFEIEIQGADMYFTNNSDNNVQTTSV